MKIKLGCKYQREVELKSYGISWTNHYQCILLDFPVPQNNNDIHSLNCPICNEPIKIHITGKHTAKLQRIMYLIFGIIILLPFLYLAVSLVIKQGFKIYDIFISLITLFVGMFLSSNLFLRVISNDFYKSASIVGNGDHKIINK